MANAVCSQCGGWQGTFTGQAETIGLRMCLCRGSQGRIKADENKYESGGKMVAQFSCPNCLKTLSVIMEEK